MLAQTGLVKVNGVPSPVVAEQIVGEWSGKNERVVCNDLVLAGNDSLLLACGVPWQERGPRNNPRDVDSGVFARLGDTLR